MFGFVFGPCFMMYALVSFLVLHHIANEETAGTAFLLSYGCLCPVSVPQGAKGWYVIVAFSDHTCVFF